jgi:histidinol-phosphate aminotransferase
MGEYHPPLAGRDGLRLDFNESTIGCSPRVLRKLASITAEQLARYPERAPVEPIVADFLGISAESTLLTNGVDEAIHLLCSTYLDSGDEVLIVVPTFGMYEIFAQQSGAVITRVPCGAEFEFPSGALAAAVTPKTRLILFANPNNPTGGVASPTQVEQILKAAPDAGVLVDEAYFEFHGETSLPLIARYENLFVARTFSKAYGLAGARIGILCGHANQMRLVRKVCSPYNVNEMALACLPEALADGEFVRQYVNEVREGRARLENELRRLGVPFWPSRANFVLMRIGDNSKAFVRAMKSRGILVRDRGSDPGCAGCVRITIGTAAQTDRLLGAVRECLSEIGWRETPKEVRA